VILDACRDNPFVRSMKRTVASRSIGRGLAEVRVLSADTLIAFSAKAGSTAADGEGSNSPYTTALVTHLTTPGLDLRLALGRVRDEVLKSTANKQEPFVYGSLGGAEIPLVVVARPQAQPAPEPKAVGRLSEAAEAWDRSKDATNIAALEVFIGRYKDTYYADLARLRIDELKKQQVAVAAPPKAPAPVPSKPAQPAAKANLPTPANTVSPKPSASEPMQAWHTVTGLNSSFNVDMPGPPKYSTPEMRTSAGSTYTMHQHLFESGPRAFVAQTAVYPNDVNVSNPRANLQGGLDNAAKNMEGGKWISIAWLTHQGSLASDAVGSKGGNAIRSFSVMKGRQIFTFTYAGPIGTHHSQDVERFLRSLHIP
jgi:hypothetical protein